MVKLVSFIFLLTVVLIRVGENKLLEDIYFIYQG